KRVFISWQLEKTSVPAWSEYFGASSYHELKQYLASLWTAKLQLDRLGQVPISTDHYFDRSARTPLPTNVCCRAGARRDTSSSISHEEVLEFVDASRQELACLAIPSFIGSVALDSAIKEIDETLLAPIARIICKLKVALACRWRTCVFCGQRWSKR